MTIAYYVFVVLHVIACLFLIGVVLLQQGKSQDLASAFGGGGTQTAFGPRGSANVLSRATTILAALFMVTSLALSMLRPHDSSFLDQVTVPSPSPSARRRGSLARRRRSRARPPLRPPPPPRPPRPSRSVWRWRCPRAPRRTARAPRAVLPETSSLKLSTNS